MSAIVEAAKAGILAYNEKNWDNFKAALSESAVYDEKATDRRIEGAGAVTEAMRGWATAIPDSAASFVRTIEGGNTVIFEVVWRGTQSGPLATPAGMIPASNKPIEVPACQVVTLENGKISQFVHYFDLMTLLGQIGAL